MQKECCIQHGSQALKKQKVKAVHRKNREKETLKVLKTNFRGGQHFVSSSLFAEGKNILHVPRIRTHSEYSY